MPKGPAWDTNLLALVFTNQAASNIGDSAGLQPSASAGSLYIALHTADPSSSSTQGANECTYTGYARVPVPRTTSDWTVSGASVTPQNPITFGTNTGSTSDTATHFSVGTDTSGSSELLWCGPISPTLTVNPGDTPELTISTNVTES